MPVRIPRKVRDDYELNFLSRGEKGFYRYVLGSAFIGPREEGVHPGVKLLQRAETFFSLYRTSENENYFIIGKILRRAAHRLHRALDVNQQDPRFLRIVK
jgi:hypothetical protein